MKVLSKKERVRVTPKDDEEIFLSNNIDIRLYPDMFKIDFKQINQQIDRVGEQKHESLIINKRCIALTPLLMKSFVGLINKVVQSYEKVHGEIKIPKGVASKKKGKKVVSSGGYIG